MLKSTIEHCLAYLWRQTSNSHETSVPYTIILCSATEGWKEQGQMCSKKGANAGTNLLMDIRPIKDIAVDHTFAIQSP